VNNEKIDLYVDLLGHLAEWIDGQLTAEEREVFYERARDWFANLVEGREQE
jgi:hypothetical protein